jgi:hypothetical protein
VASTHFRFGQPGVYERVSRSSWTAATFTFSRMSSVVLALSTCQISRPVPLVAIAEAYTRASHAYRAGT